MAAAKPKPEVTVRMSATLGDGGMNFRKVEIAMMCPCDLDDIDETYSAVKDFVKGNLDEAVAEVIAENPGLGEAADPNAGTDLDAEL